jgi:CBS domain-containing protein
MKRPVRELMTVEFDKVSEDETIHEAVKKIAASRRTTIASVVDREGKLKGLLTPRDILEALEVREFGGVRSSFFAGHEVLHLLTSKYAKDIMSAPVSVKADNEVWEAINTMLDHGVYELPVVDEHMKVMGAITFFDILINTLRDDKA